MKNENNDDEKIPDYVKGMRKACEEAGVELERTDEDPDRLLIRYLLSFPPEKRTNFLRVRLPNGGSTI